MAPASMEGGKRWSIVALGAALVALLGFLVTSRQGARPDPVAAERLEPRGDGVRPALERVDELEFAADERETDRTLVRTAPESPRQPPAADDEAAPGWGRLALTVLGEPSAEPVPGLYLHVAALAPDAAAPAADANAEVARGNARESETDGAARGNARETDGAGRIATEVRAGLALLVEVRGIGLGEPLAALELDPFAADEERELEVRVDDARLPCFWVRVVAAEDGAPLLGARVLDVDAYGDELDTGGAVDAARWRDRDPLARPDGGGLVRLPISPMVQKRFAAVADGRGPVFFVQPRDARRPELAREVRLARAASLDVTVVDAAGRPVGGADVRVDGEFAALQGLGEVRSFGIFGRHAVLRPTDAAGRARFDELPAGAALRAAVRAPGYGDGWQEAPEPLAAFVPGEHRDLTLVARRPTDVHGVARDQHGAPAAGIELLLLRDSGEIRGYVPFHATGLAQRRTSVGDDGRFRFEAVPAGRWLVAPRPLRDVNDRSPHGGVADLEGLVAPVPSAFELTGDVASFDLELVLWRDLYVRGVVELGDSGPPTGEALLVGRLGDDEGVVVQRAEQDGTFALGPLPDLSVELEASDPSGATSERVVCRPGDEDLVLRLRSGGTLVVRTRHAATGADLACDFTAWRTVGAGEVVEQRRYGAAGGLLEWEGLTPGTWSVLARAAPDLVAFRTGLDVRADGSTEAVLELARGGTLVLSRPEAAANAPSSEARPMVVRFAGLPAADPSLAPGAVFEITLPAGEVELRERQADAGPARAPRSAILSPGERTTVVLEE